ncbi:MAG: response regulator transcription factor [Spirochaetales bacterium]|nr:response regulator transcription factor [Spirochaetales bacterium]
MKRALIVEDDRAIAELERDYLEAAGFAVELAADGDTGIERLAEGGWALAIVDLMLPGADGFAVCREARRLGETPLMVVSARGADLDKVRALGLGADDYLVKPFSPAELVARAKAHVERYERLRGGGADGRIVVSGGLSVDLGRKLVKRGDAEIPLTATEWSLLAFLAEEPGRVRSREEIFARLRGEGAYGDQNAVAVHIRRLREKIELDPSSPGVVETVWGLGYRLRG